MWLVIAVVSRDILIVIAVLLSWLLGHPMRIRPLIVSKANTVAQIVLAATVLADEGFGLELAGRVLVLVWLTAALTSHRWLPICTVGCYTCPAMKSAGSDPD